MSPDCPSTTRHDTLAAFDWPGCRCPLARKANARRQKTYQFERAQGIYRTIPATGSARRVRALIAIGWSQDLLGARLGVSVQRLSHLHRKQKRVLTTTAARIDALYRELSDTPGPSYRARSAGRRYGYLPPMAWDDDTIDDPAAEPAEWSRPERRVRAADRVEDIVWLRRAGTPDDQIAERIGLNPKSLATYVARVAS